MEKIDDKTVSPKIEIINHFDNLIQRIDIDIEECLEKYNEEQVIGDLKCYKSYKKNEMKSKRKINKNHSSILFFLNEISMKTCYENYHIQHKWFESAKNKGKYRKFKKTNNSFDLECDKIYKTVDLWSEETKVVDYLNQVRTRTIEELRKAQEDALESYKSQKDDSKRKLFPDKFYIQVRYTQKEPEEWIFKLFTFVTDFYLSPVDVTLFE